MHIQSKPDVVSDHKSHRPSADRAFTLVELLVVIGIIAVLMGVLLPALGAANRAAKITQCLAVQRQVGVAATNYAVTHKGYCPVAGSFVGPKTAQGAELGDANLDHYSYQYVNEGTTNGNTLACWQASLASYMGKKGVLNGGNNGDFLQDEIGIRSYLKYFICPADKGNPADLPEAMIYQSGVGNDLVGWSVQQSYLLNEAVFGINDAMGRLRGQMARVKRPSVTVMMAEGKPGLPRGNPFVGPLGWMTFVNYQAPDPTTLPITLADALTPPVVSRYTVSKPKAGDPQSFDKLRHRGKIDILFCDGHAETRMITTADLRSACLITK